MKPIHNTLLDHYFWAYVDAGIDPDNTPLFRGAVESQVLSESIASQFGISALDAEEAIEMARMEVAL